MRPPLSYSLPAYRPGGYAAHRRWLNNLRELGFRWVTLHPSFLVTRDLRIHLDRSPPMPEIAEVLGAARELDFSVQLEPHLDWESTLTGGAYEWRNSMPLDPLGEYADLVIGPLREMQPDYLTLGSELDFSLTGFPERWLRLRQTSREGHKVNHDFRDFHGAKNYFRTLHYVAFSFYPGGTAFAQHAWRMGDALPDGPRFAVGEFGLGSPDIARPWKFDAESFQTLSHFELRRWYYRDFLATLKSSPEAFGSHPVTFWTSGHFDFLGALEWPGLERFRDEVLRAEVQAYNTEEKY